MRRRTNPTVCLFYLITVLLQVVHEVIQVGCREILPRNDYGGRMGGEADRLEVAL
jgi:hypothetical protein